MAAPTATATPFLLPLSSSSPSISSSHSASISSSSSSFFAGGTLLWSHERSASDSFTSSSSISFKFRSRASSNSSGLVICASGDYYATLRVPKSANSKQIKAAYRKLARQYHPDVNKEPGAAEKFKEISAAYEVLSEDNKRALYDQYGEVGVKSTVGGQSSTFTVWELLYLCYILCLFFFAVISFGVVLYNGKS